MPEYVTIPVRKTAIIVLILILVVIGVKWKHRIHRQTEILRYDRLGMELMMVGNKLNAISVSPEGPSWTWAQHQPPQDTGILMAQKRREIEKAIYSQIDPRGYRFGMSLANAQVNAKKRGDHITASHEGCSLTNEDGTRMELSFEGNHLMTIFMAGSYGGKSGIKQGCSVADVKRIFGEPDFVMNASSGTVY